MPTSQEFLDVCRAQLKLLVQGLGVSFGVVYLTTEGSFEAESPTLNPVVAYPETTAREATRFLPGTVTTSETLTSAPNALPDFLPAGFNVESPDIKSSDINLETNIDSQSMRPGSDASGFNAPIEQANQGQVVVPLTHSTIVFGVLVIARVNQTWTASEQYQIEQVAQAIAAACMMDRRMRWVNQKLRQQHLAYEAFHQQQDSMLDTLLHQLRNPLTAVQTFGKLLLRRVQPGDANRSAAEGIVRESDRIRLLLEQLDRVMAPLPPTLPAAESAAESATQIGYDIIPAGPSDAVETSAAPITSAHILTGGALELFPLNLNEVLNPLMLTALALAQERQIEIYREDIRDSQHQLWVRADASALQEVLSNLLDNAIKYTPAGGYVEVRSGITDGEMQTVLIADTGPGIPADDQRHLFERHFRGVQAEGDIPGTGLGLAIAQELMQQMGGCLEVYSPAAKSPLLSSHYPDHAAGTAIALQLPSSDAPA